MKRRVVLLLIGFLLISWSAQGDSISAPLNSFALTITIQQ